MEKPSNASAARDGPSQIMRDAREGTSGPQGSLLDQYIASQQQQQQAQAQAQASQRRAEQQAPHSPNSAGSSSQQQQQSTAQVTETSGVLRLCLDLPGVAGRDVDVTIHRGVLMVRGVRKTYSVDRRHVIKKVQFVRRFAIDTDVVDIHHAKANLAKGVLVVMAPKKHAPHGIRIPVTEDPKWNPFRHHAHHQHHHHQEAAAAAAAVKVEESTDTEQRPDEACSSSLAAIVSDDTSSQDPTSGDEGKEASSQAENMNEASSDNQEEEKQHSRSSSTASSSATSLAGSKRKLSNPDEGEEETPSTITASVTR